MVARCAGNLSRGPRKEKRGGGGVDNEAQRSQDLLEG